MQETCDILIRDAEAVLLPGIELKKGLSIVIEGARIKEIGDYAAMDAKYQPTETLDARGKLAMPGFTDAHMHACQHLLRGSLADEYPMVWARFLVPFESSLTEDDSYFSGQLTYLQGIKSGITTFNESGGIHMHMVASAAEESGVRANIARSTMDQGADFLPANYLETAENCIRRTEELYRNCHGRGNGRVRVFFAMRQVMSCSAKLMRMIGEAAASYQTGIHAHLAEHRDEVIYCLKNYQKRPVEVFLEHGILTEKLICAHSVMLSEQEIELLKEYNAKLVHCPRSNLGNHGIPKTPRMLHAGLSIGIGSDGASGCNMDLLEELRLLRFAVQATQGLPVFDPMILPIRSLLEMLLIGGARAAMLFEEVGRLEAGRKADIILLDTRQPHIMPCNHMENVIVEGMRGSDVTDSIIDGKLVMRNREVLTLDEEKLLARSAQRLSAALSRAGL